MYRVASRGPFLFIGGMNDAQRQALREQLEEEIASCRQRVESREDNSAPVAPDPALGRLTRMESLNDQGVSQAALGQARERLYQLENALKQIDDPAFGSCRICRQPIPLERLLALPESTLCVRCASAR